MRENMDEIKKSGNKSPLKGITMPLEKDELTLAEIVVKKSI
jgi:hypothetical protein